MEMNGATQGFFNFQYMMLPLGSKYFHEELSSARSYNSSIRDHRLRLDALKTEVDALKPSKDEPIEDSSNLSRQIRSFAYANVSETLLWELYTSKGTCLYKVDRETESVILMKKGTRKVKCLFDQTLSGLDSKQNNAINMPLLCNKEERLNNRYYLKFDGAQTRMISDVNLNTTSGKDIVNIFIVYKVDNQGTGGWVTNGLFGHDNGGYDKFVGLGSSGQLMIGGTTGDYIAIGSTGFLSKKPISGYPANADASGFERWVVLSIHWDVDGGEGASTVWCNGKKITKFTAKATTGSTTMTFGDLNPGGAFPLNGGIASFFLYKGIPLSDNDIKLHHHVLCKNWYQIQHDEIVFD